MRTYLLDENGDPKEVNAFSEEFLKDFDDGFYRLKFTKVSDKVWVSTVFLYFDHNYFENGPPILWETMIFGGKHDEYQERYSSKAEALEGHERAVELARGKKSLIVDKLVYIVSLIVDKLGRIEIWRRKE